MPVETIAACAEPSGQKLFMQLRARAARAGHKIHLRSEHGRQYYLATCWGQCRRFERLDQLQIFVDLVTGVIDVTIRKAERAE